MAHDETTELPSTAHPEQHEELMRKLVSRSRRNFLFKLSVLLNGAVGAALAVPIVGYLLGPASKKTPFISLSFRPFAVKSPPRPRPPHPWRLAVDLSMGRAAAFNILNTRT